MYLLQDDKPGMDAMVREVCTCPEYKGGDIGGYKDTSLIVFRDGKGSIVGFGSSYLKCIEHTHKVLLRRRLAKINEE